MGRSTLILLDTCTLLWQAFEPAALSERARETIQQAKQVAISSITIWEIGIKVKKNRLSIPIPVDSLVGAMKESLALEVIPVEDRHWLGSLALEWDHQDPADRVIVATATLDDLPLVTEDRLIRAYYSQAVW